MQETELRQSSDFFGSGGRFIGRYGFFTLMVVCLFVLLLTNSWAFVALVGAIGCAILLRSRRIALEIDRENNNVHLHRWLATRTIPFGLICCYRFGKRYSAGPQRILFELVDGSRVASYGFCLDQLFSRMTTSERQHVVGLLAPLRPCEDSF